MGKTTQDHLTLEKFRAWPSLPAMIFDVGQRKRNQSLFWHKDAGLWHSTPWGEVLNLIAALSRALRKLGLSPGDRVVLISENRPEWAIADIAIMAARGVSVPTYTTNTAADHRHILSDSGAKIVIVSSAKLAAPLLEAIVQVPSVTTVISMESVRLPVGSNLTFLSWLDALALGRAQVDDVVDYIKSLQRSDLACLIYTSGTGGTPKGVMLSHGAILCNAMGAFDLLHRTYGLDREVFLSFLPLSHSYEHSAGLFFPLSIGAEIYYAEGADKLALNLPEVRPTIMTAVPRFYETMHQRILQAVLRQSPWRKKLFMDAVTFGRKKFLTSDRLVWHDRFYNLVLDYLVRRKIRKKFGGRLKGMISGGGPLNPEIGIFFTALGVEILQGYGLTEAAPIVSCNPPGHVRMDTVGPPFRDVDISFASDGEILVRGELVMMGYWNQLLLTKEVIRDGWLHTGDIGTLSPEGYLKITDRKKDIIISSGGDNIAPAKIENLLTLPSEIHQAMVYGDQRPYLVALIVPDPDFVKLFAANAGTAVDLDTLRHDQNFKKNLASIIDRINKDLSPIERIRRFAIADEVWSLDNGFLTPSLKIKRYAVRKKYETILDALY
ncbi:MAG: long-chain fatty acid--CoA ligase [Alphaproteobacteria bacterium]